MIIRIRTKLIFSISTLILLILSVSAFLLTNEKRLELSSDMYLKNLAFSKLIAESVAENYDNFLKENNFIYFNREVKNIFSQNPDLTKITLITYSGEILYDSSQDIEKKYEGNVRILSDAALLNSVRSKKPSFLSGQNYYFLGEDENGNMTYYDFEDNLLDGPRSGFFASNFVIPVFDKYGVVFEYDYSKLQDRIAQLIERIAILTAFGVLLGILLSVVLAWHFNRPVRKLLNATENISKGDYDSRVDIKTRDELSLLGMAFNKMARDLKASLDARVYKERLGRELELAGQIQNQLVPKKVPEIPGLDISAALLPAEEIGGDMYDFLPTEDENHIFYLGDVTGHGIPAGLLSSISSALFFGFAKITDLKDILIRVNEVFHAKTMSNMFMTLCLVTYNDILNKLTYVSAGHEQIVHFDKSSGTAILKPAGGVALGMTRDISKLLKEVTFQMNSGDFAVIYSDGIPECWNDKRQLYGMQRLVNLVQSNGALGSSKEMQDAILRDVKIFANGYKQMDDITIIVLRKT
ncbi:MAG: SpoIIE family protein phosphatase [Candidatus Gracilibacteria bacterium]|jgi:HAMP domain-containing protein|nr:SpoIIE family protein phosphatase [Candidatus Gracilibacteria bacterium]